MKEYLRATFPNVTVVKEDRLVPAPAVDLLPGTLSNLEAVERVSDAIRAG